MNKSALNRWVPTGGIYICSILESGSITEQKLSRGCAQMIK